MEAALQRLDGNAKLCGGLGRAQALNVSKQDDLAVERVQARERRGEDLGATSSSQRFLGIVGVVGDVVAFPVGRERRTLSSFDHAQTFAANDGEEPARDGRSGATERLDRTRCRPKRLLHGVLGVLGRPADLESEPVNALPVLRDEAIQGGDISSPRGDE